MNKDPALLVCKVIENNPTVYREADRMMKILTDLIDSIDLFQHNPETLILETNRMQARVYAALTTAALSENDFTTAYSTCINKLSPLTSSNPTDQVLVNTTWTAFYQTGIYTGRSSTRIPPSYLDFQKMELLARALLICPKDNIEIILRHWTHLEEKQLHPEITEHKTQSSDHAARGTTSPLISGDSRNGSFDMERETNSSWGGSSSRFGVRDTVKTGLTQGIGWLLGATSPLDSNDEDQRI
jgi:hypothetical protein